ncbi:MAG TPA: hypothetical protein VIP70_06900 [Nitrososphaeraceae archaeon]
MSKSKKKGDSTNFCKSLNFTFLHIVATESALEFAPILTTDEIINLNVNKTIKTTEA